MAEIKILGNSMTIFSSLKTEELKKILAVAPECTKLYETAVETGLATESFMVSLTDEVGSVSPFGICFDSTDEEGKAFLTLRIDREEGLDLEAIITRYMPTMFKLNQIEAGVKTALENIDENIEAIKKAVTVIG